MDMRFGTWNVRSLYRAGSLMTVAKKKKEEKKNQNINYIQWEYRSYGTRVALNQQANIFFSMERAMRIMN
jgi:hypothetical protein